MHQHVRAAEVLINEVVCGVEEAVDVLFLVVLQVDGEATEFRRQFHILLLARDRKYGTDLHCAQLLDVPGHVDAGEAEAVLPALRVEDPGGFGDQLLNVHAIIVTEAMQPNEGMA